MWTKRVASAAVLHCVKTNTVRHSPASALSRACTCSADVTLSKYQYGIGCRGVIVLIQPLLVHARRVPRASARQLLRAAAHAHAHCNADCDVPEHRPRRQSARSTGEQTVARYLSQVLGHAQFTLVLVAPWQPPATMMFRPSVTQPNMPPGNKTENQHSKHAKVAVMRVTFAGQRGAASPPTNAGVENLTGFRFWF
jgi:hypothetical protein